MFRNLLKPDSALMITMTQITDCIFLSLFFVVGCVPVVTVGASFAALYDSVFHGLRKGDKHSWQRFLATYRENWKESILPTLVLYAAVFVLGKVLISLWNGAVYGEHSFAVFSGAAFLAVVAVGILSVLFPMLSRFENPFGQLVKNTVFLAMANLPRTLVLGMVNTVCAIVCLYYVFPLFFLPGLAALIDTVFIEPMFKPYLN